MFNSFHFSLSQDKFDPFNYNALKQFSFLPTNNFSSVSSQFQLFFSFAPSQLQKSFQLQMKLPQPVTVTCHLVMAMHI
jgi:hypothetical protein